MIKADPDYRPNPKRAVFVQGRIDQQLVDKLTPEILRLQYESRDPITVYIDSPGGETSSAEAISYRLQALDQVNSRSCRIITVVTGLAASAAADLLCSGGYAIAYAESVIFFHGMRRSGTTPITVATASSIVESLRISNDRYAIALADKSIRRIGFRYMLLRGEFTDYRQTGNQEATNLDCFVGLIREHSSSDALKVVDRALSRNQRYEALIAFVSRRIAKRSASTLPLPRDWEALALKSIIDFERSRNKNNTTWTFIDQGLKQVNDDFLLVHEYLNNYDGDPLSRLCDSWGDFFLSQDQRMELAAIDDEDHRRRSKNEIVKPLLRPLWLFCVALCYALQEDENELTAADAVWLGLIDEVIGGGSTLIPFRLIVEDVPDPHEADNPIPSSE